MIDRRMFLRAAGLTGAGAVLTGCSGETPPPGPPTSAVASSLPPVSSPGPPPAPDWQTLRAGVSGGVLLPAENGFDTARLSYNSLRDANQPAAIARCLTPADVGACIETASRSKIPIAARSGGHSYAGYSSPPGGLLVDLAGMSAVEMRADGTVRVGAGVRLMDLYTALAKAGRCLPAGSCPTVGIAGLTLGGGIGVLSRKYGLTCDRMEAATVVTAAGRTVEASTGSEPGLYWALRGGGGGNFGIVTEFIFATEPAPDVVTFSLRFAAAATPGVVTAWQEWIASAPNELWSNCVITGAGTPACRIGGCFVGSTDAFTSQLNGFLAKTKARPTSRLVQAKGYLDAMTHFATGKPGRQSFVASSRMLTAPVDGGAIVALLKGRIGMDLLLDSLGGAVSAVPPEATAFPHRKALASAQIYLDTTAADAQQAGTAVGEVRDGLGALAGPAGYVNYIDPTMPDWANAYYGANLPRLKTIVKQYDPEGTFAFAQAV